MTLPSRITWPKPFRIGTYKALSVIYLFNLTSGCINNAQNFSDE